MRMRPRVTWVIMAGGRGERLWPLVRARTPKVCLSPDRRRTLLGATVERLAPIAPGAEWLIVTTREQAAPVRAVLPRRLRAAVVVEPAIKNTAACLTLAAAMVAAEDPHRVLVAVPADHWIDDVGAFRRAIRAAIAAAVTHDTLATIGLRPAAPHAGLGYLRAGRRLTPQHGTPVFQLDRFIEKPSVAQARRLIRQGRMYWNSGTFIGTAERFLAHVEAWLPHHASRLMPVAARCARARQRRGRIDAAAARQLATAYRPLESVSFDQGVMAHLRGGVVVEGRFQWADLGSWDVWAQMGGSASPTVAVESRDVAVISHSGHLVATIGVEGVVIVHTPTATLVCRRDRAQAVRDVVRRLSADPKLAGYC